MSDDSAPSAVEEILSCVSACLDQASAESLSRLRAPAVLQQRIETLATRNTEGLLSDDEREEYESLVHVGGFVAVLQAHARRLLVTRHEA